MHFAYPLPWWLALLLLAAIASAAFAEYRRPLAPLTRAQRAALVGLRVLALAILVLFLFRPVVSLPPAGGRDVIVPVLVDVSRSMRLNDADGQSRMARATALLTTDLLPSLSASFSTPLFAIGDGVAPATVDRLSADARRSDLTAAVAAIRERYRGQRVAGIVVVSDGGDTGEAGGAGRAGAEGAEIPIMAIGVGSPEGLRDREVLSVTAGDAKLDQTSIDLRVSAVSTGFGRAPFSVQIRANGKAIDARRIVPGADGSPIDALFTVFPDPAVPTVYTAEIAADDAEAVPENNSRSVLVSPAGRKRHLLVIAGAPGFEHGFMTRAWSVDPGLDFDSVTRKGKNTEGQDTFFVQAGAGRAPALTTGVPAKREQFYAYDALVVANVEGDFFTRAHLTMIADFVAERGGGLLVLGGRSFAKGGLAGTPLEDVLPVELTDRRGGLARAALGPGDLAGHNRLTMTPEGEQHPVMRVGGSPEETRTRWASLPPLAASAALGAPRPGATVLGVTAAPGGALFPMVAVQRYGQGRSMIFAGEASWRWKMLAPSSDRTYEFFWRQAARWLASSAPDPVSLSVPETPEPGDTLAIEVDARDATFTPVQDAEIEATVTGPGGDTQLLKFRVSDAAGGRSSAAIRPERAGLYRVHADARRRGVSLGTADRWVYVGGADREFAGPRLNEGFLRRLAQESGGRYARANEASRVASWLRSVPPPDAAAEQRDLWHNGWVFTVVVLLVSAEWVLRRRWGLR